MDFGDAVVCFLIRSIDHIYPVSGKSPRLLFNMLNIRITILGQEILGIF